MPGLHDAATNRDTWHWVEKFYGEWLLQYAHSQHLTPLHRLVKAIAASERADRFRAGQSLDTLMISTTTYHGLRPEDPRVTVHVLRPIEEYDVRTLFDQGLSLRQIAIGTGYSRHSVTRIVRQATPAKESARLEVSYWGPRAQCLERHLCTERNVLTLLDRVLDRLWSDTKRSP